MKLIDYLPYLVGCKFVFPKSGRIITVKGFQIIGNSAVLYDEEQKSYWIDVWDFKPMLRPLESCTKDEEKNMPLVYHSKDAAQRVLEYATAIKYLTDNFFDVFGLIEAGLAENINDWQ